VPAKAGAATRGHALRGRVNLLVSNRQSVDARDLSETVIYYLPEQGLQAPPPRRFIMDTRSKGFSPDLLVITTGSTVSFPNGDPILHNVYSDTPGLAFDLGLYGEGETREARFDRAGLVAVHCNVHSAMQAKILVLETPFFTRADAQGRYELPDLPAGLGTLVAWHPRALALSQPIAVPTADAVELRLTVSRPRAGSGR